jgi:membrane fusion protein, multidrug efflux system
MENVKEHPHSATGVTATTPHAHSTAAHSTSLHATAAIGAADHARPAQAEVHDGEYLPHVLRIGTAGVAVFAMLFVAVLVGLFLLGWYPHRQLQADIQADLAATRDALPVVAISTPKKQAQTRRVMLPADVQAFQHTLIFARANGYLKKLSVDIGQRVEAGQLLAEIEAPEVDAQLERARAAVREAEANVQKTEVDQTLGESTLQRYNSIDPKAITQQQVDEVRAQLRRAVTSVDVARASLASSQAEVRQLEAQQGFQKVIAPFSGVITARNVDVGALISSSSGGSTKELFQIDQVDTLRVFVKVPQDYATAARPGKPAELKVGNYPNRVFAGTVVRSSGSIDPDSRTLRVEVDVPNRENLLLPGMYGQVTLEVTRDRPVVLIPTSAMIYDATGLSVATVQGGRIKLQRVTAGQDMGTEMEITDGLTGSESVISNPGGRLEDGAEVQVVRATSAPAKSSK